MKNLILILLLQISANAFSQIQFAGFDRSVCPQAMSNTYTYANFSTGGGSGKSYGYTIYKNSNAVFSQSGTMGDGKQCKDLLFINDSVGFLVYYSGNTANRVLRTEDYGQTWSDAGGGAPNYFGLYVVNAAIAYLVTQWDTPLQLYIARCSNTPSSVNATFIYDQTITTDVFKVDTLLDADLCKKDSLNIFVLNGSDTITYHINFIVLNTGMQSSLYKQEIDCLVYPNPSGDLFHLSFSPGNIESVTVFSLSGSEIITYDKQSIDQNRYSLSGISTGIYVARIAGNEEIIYRKLIVSKDQ